MCSIWLQLGLAALRKTLRFAADTSSSPPRYSSTGSLDQGASSRLDLVVMFFVASVLAQEFPTVTECSAIHQIFSPTVIALGVRHFLAQRPSQEFKSVAVVANDIDNGCQTCFTLFTKLCQLGDPLSMILIQQKGCHTISLVLSWPILSSHALAKKESITFADNVKALPNLEILSIGANSIQRRAVLLVDT